MKRFYTVALLLFGACLFLSACESSNSDNVFSLSGRVVNSINGNPINEAIVEITSPEEVRRTAITDTTGAFQFNDIDLNETTNVVVEAKKTGFVTTTVNVVASPGLTVDLDQAISLVPDASQEFSIVIEGIVLNNQDNTPINEAVVEIISPASLNQSVITAADGTFIFPEVGLNKTTDLVLEAKKTNFSRQTKNLVATPELDIQLTDPFYLTPIVNTAGVVTITGQVNDESTGTGLNEAIVEIISPASINRTLVTGADGSFTFNTVSLEKTTDIVIEAKKTGYTRKSVSVVATPGFNVDIGAPINLAPENSTANFIDITGTVNDASTSAGLEGAIAEIISPTTLRQSVLTDVSGNFTLSNVNIVNTTDIVVELKKTGYNRKTVSVVATPGVNLALPNTVVLTPENSAANNITITGNVIDQSVNLALDSAIVDIIAPSSLAQTVLTDASGNFTFSPVNITQTTDIVIEAKKTGYDRKSVSIVATPGVNVSLSSSIGLIPENNVANNITIDGVVIDDATDAGLDEAIIEIISPAALNQTVLSDATGAFTINSNISKTTEIILEAKKTGYDRKSISVIATPGSSITLASNIILVPENSTANYASVSGRVIDAGTANGLNEAVVEIISPNSLNEVFVTDATGNFTFNNININSATEITIEAKKTGYTRQSVNVVLSPGLTVSLTNPLTLEVDNAGGDGGGVFGPSTGAAQIVLVNAPDGAINIAETGNKINTTFTFEVQDSAGRALTSSNPAVVYFTVLEAPAGAAVTPDSVATNSDGQVTASLFSGNTAGVVRIEARIERPEIPLTIRSTPVLISIHGGFPDANHFTFSFNDKQNIQGWDRNGILVPLSVIVGDEFGNPVKPGTSVYFTTDGGIVGGSTTTGTNGQGSVTLTTGNPKPAAGLVTVTATTVDKNSAQIQETVTLRFSGAPLTPVITSGNASFAIPADGGETFDYEITDVNGNPVAAGSRILVQASATLELTGDVDFVLGDYLTAGAGKTQFSFSAADTDPDNSTVTDTNITITVTTPAGSTSKLTLSGTRAKTIKK